MKSLFESTLRTAFRVVWLVCLACIGTAAWADALPFDAQTWKQLVEKGPRPAAYVFTTTYCSTCPDAFDQLSKAVQQHARARPSAKKPVLSVVIMDAQGEKALAHAHHFHGASQIYTFDGQEAALRYSVDPQWRNVTPYMVLIDQKGQVQRAIGSPEHALLRRWLM